jgi:predicted Fe-Mo cluster-binding NifX family protein
MKIAVSASGQELSSHVDPRFGRCAYFLFIDSETMQLEPLENPNVASPSGAGIQSAQLVAEKGANVLITGSCGPNAFQTLQAAAVNVVVGATGTVQGAIHRYKSGGFQSSTRPNVTAHSGMDISGKSSMESRFEMGKSMGRGMGRRIGRGLGMRISRGSRTLQPSAEEELQNLKQQAELLRQQMGSIANRIKELEMRNK